MRRCPFTGGSDLRRWSAIRCTGITEPLVIEGYRPVPREWTRASGLSLSTVQNGARAVDAGIEPSDRVRAPGAGRPPATESMPGLVDALDRLVEPDSRGDPECALRWTTKSTRTLEPYQKLGPPCA